MTNTQNRVFSWRIENTLAAGFFLIILLGLLGYFQTVHAMQASARRTHQMVADVDSCISLAKDVTLHSHDTSFYMLAYVYSGNTGDLDQKWETQDQTRADFENLKDQLKLLPGSASLQAQCAAAERQNREVCEPQELREINLTNHGHQAQAQGLLQTAGTSGRDNLEVQLDDLIGVNPTQYSDAAPRGLNAYRIQAEAAENRFEHHTLLIGEAVQGVILLFSLLITLIVIRIAASGVRSVLAVQDTLRESEARYRVLFEGNPHPIWIFDQVSLNFLEVNDAALRSYGYTREEFLALKYGSMRADENLPALSVSEHNLLTETKNIGERRHKKKDGSVFWVDVVLHPLAWDGYTTCMAIVQDISDRREAEAGLNRLAAIINSSHDAIIGWNSDQIVMDWNPGAERLYGWTAEEIRGKSIEVLMPPDREEEQLYIKERLRLGQPVELADTVRRHKNGRLLEVSIYFSVIRNAAQEMIGTSTIARDISEQKKAQALIRWQAYNDPLTRLPNRARFQQVLEDALLRAMPFSVLFVDLDQFKHVNDSLGHAAGDQMLQEVAARLERCLETGEILARMGGDEFTLLLPGEAGSAGCENPGCENPGLKAEALLQALAQPLVIEGHELHVAASIGISRFPDDGATAETLLKHADLAMYQSKEGGRRQWQVFSPVMTEAAQERLTLESSLRKAVERKEFRLLYQPQVSLKTGEIIGAEALVRWQHPEMGLVAPSRFIPLAEETGLIVPLGEEVLRIACRQAACWERAGKPLRQSVNLSARQLREIGLVQTVQAALEETGLSPHLLDLELTESALVAQDESAVGRLAALRALGVRISLDDFGTGYSSLAYLRRFPLDVLKVDRAFVQGLEETHHTARQDQAVVQAIIDMAHALDLEVIAEGVETAAQRDLLRQLGCDYMQGFLYSPPVTPERLESLFMPAYLQAREAQAA